MPAYTALSAARAGIRHYTSVNKTALAVFLMRTAHVAITAAVLSPFMVAGKGWAVAGNADLDHVVFVSGVTSNIAYVYAALVAFALSYTISGWAILATAAVSMAYHAIDVAQWYSHDIAYADAMDWIGPALDMAFSHSAIVIVCADTTQSRPTLTDAGAVSWGEALSVFAVFAVTLVGTSGSVLETPATIIVRVVVGGCIAWAVYVIIKRHPASAYHPVVERCIGALIAVVVITIMVAIGSFVLATSYAGSADTAREAHATGNADATRLYHMYHAAWHLASGTAAIAFMVLRYMYDRTPLSRDWTRM